jgi:tRNA pseudouridine55 synthase
VNGILLVCKPEGMTSADVVRRIKRRARTKVGHLGTLDPFATGLLPLCLGEGTKVAQFLNQADKRYEGEIALGTATDTGDDTGAVVSTAALPHFDDADLAALERRFHGEYEQTPPMYSALKQQGVPLYRLARRGIEVERAARRVRIDEIHLREAGPGRLRFDVACSKGTYVRVLAADIGVALGTCAHLASLRRTRFGSFDLADAVAHPDAWDPAARQGWLSLRAALSHLPAVRLGAAASAAVRLGKVRVLAEVGLPAEARQAVLLDPAGEVVAVVVRDEQGWRFGRVFQAAPALQDSGSVVFPAE